MDFWIVIGDVEVGNRKQVVGEEIKTVSYG